VLKVLLGVIRRELQLACRRPSEILTVPAFFAIAAMLFPLGVGAEATLLRAIAPGVLWVAALLASLLSLARLFALDHADGTLEQMLLAAEPLPVIVMAKVFAHWLVSGLPLTVLEPLLGLQFGLDGRSIAVLCASLLIGTPVLSLFGAVGAALTLGARGGGALLSLLLLPLYTPVLVFGAGAVAADAGGTGGGAHLLLLGGMLTATLALAPWAASAALRIVLE
jgi:heme exporter protein B